jgi:hypothetical protein
MGRQFGGQHRSNALDALKLLDGAETTVCVPVGHDARSEGWADTGELVQLGAAGAIHVNETGRATGPLGVPGKLSIGCRPRPCRRDCYARGRGRRVRLGSRWAPTPSARNGRIHGGNLPSQRLAVVGRDLRGAERAATPDADPQGRDRGNEEEGAPFGWSGHSARCPARERGRAPFLREQHHNFTTHAFTPSRGHISRTRVIATSPTTCRVFCETLSAVSSGVWW